MRFDLWLSYARRNLRSGLKGFWIFLSCLTLGVSAIAIIGSLAASIQQGLDEQGQPLLGGDLEFALTQREASGDELSYIKSLGATSAVATLRAMAQSNGASTLVELEPAAADGFSSVHGAFGVSVDPLLLSRLNLKIGDDLKLGKALLHVRSAITLEPDRIGDGIIFGPRILLSLEALKATGLVEPGSLVTWRYRVKLAQDESLKSVKALEKMATQAGVRAQQIRPLRALMSS
jgi:putative ABC transport system permease protein